MAEQASGGRVKAQPETIIVPDRLAAQLLSSLPSQAFGPASSHNPMAVPPLCLPVLAQDRHRSKEPSTPLAHTMTTSPQPQFEVPEPRSGRSRSPAVSPEDEWKKPEEGATAAAASSTKGSSSADRKRESRESSKDHKSSRHKHHRRSRSRERSSRDRRSRSRSRDRSSRRRRDSRSRSRSRSRSSRSRRRSPRSRSYSRSPSRDRSRDRRSSKYDPSSIRSALGTGESSSLIQLQQATQNPQLTRIARRLYVGNLPANTGLTEGVIQELFSSTVIALGIATPNPVLSVWLSTEQTFCFVEFRSVQDCAVALTLLQGIQIGGRTLRVGRPADYKPLPPHLSNYVVGNPLGVGAPPPTFATNIPFMQALTQGRSPLTDPIVMAMLANPPPTPVEAPAAAAAAGVPAVSAAIPPLDPSAAFSPGAPSRVLLLENMVSAADLSDDDSFNDLVIDIEEECEKHGALAGVVIPRPIAAAERTADEDDKRSDKQASSLSAPRVALGQGTGRIFVRYQSVDSAVAAQAKLHGRNFEGRRVVASFYAEDKLDKQQFV